MIPANDAASENIVPLVKNPASKRFRAEFLRKRVTVPEDAGLGELLDHIMEHGIFLELSSRLKLLSFPLRGARERLIIDWSNTEVSPRRLRIVLS
jgi:hypothetical protein